MEGTIPNWLDTNTSRAHVSPVATNTTTSIRQFPHLIAISSTHRPTMGNHNHTHHPSRKYQHLQNWCKSKKDTIPLTQKQLFIYTQLINTNPYYNTKTHGHHTITLHYQQNSTIYTKHQPTSSKHGLTHTNPSQANHIHCNHLFPTPPIQYQQQHYCPLHNFTSHLLET